MFKLPNEVIDGIKDYKSAALDFINGNSSPARFAGVRVPWGMYSHRGGKVFMSRIRVPAGLITGEQLEAICYCAKKYGNGVLHITTRQDIQLHAVKIEDTVKVMEYLKDFQLSPRGGGGNTVRNVTACIYSGICKDQVFDVNGYAVALTEYLMRRENSFTLPRKFKIVFAGCVKDCPGCLINDVGILAVKKGDQIGFKVFAGGGMGKESRIGRLLEEFILEQDLGYCVEAIKNAYYKHGDRRNKHHNRMRFLIDDIGFDKFKDFYIEELKDIKEKEYISLRNIKSYEHRVADGAIPGVDDQEYKDFLAYNVLAQKQAGFFSVQLRIPRGDISSGELEKVASLAKDFPGIEFRVFQNQNIVIAWVKNQDLHKIFLRIKTILEDFIYPETLLDVVACKGALTCNLGLCNSPGLAVAIEEMVKKDFVGKEAFKKLEIRVNGCPNSCGQHPIGKVSFYGMAKRVDNRPVPFYKLLLGGRKNLEGTKFAREVGLIPARNLPAFIAEFCRESEEPIKANKDIWSFLDNQAFDIAKRVLEKFSYVPSYSQDKSFYVDWGKDEEFSLSGLGPGECGAGVLDMIDSDLAESKIALEGAQKSNYSIVDIKKSLFLSARSLLIVKGHDPKDQQEALVLFIKKFVDEGVADKAYSNIEEVFSSLIDGLSQEEKKDKFKYAQDFHIHITQIYKSMDSSLNFPKQGKPLPEEVKIANILDLKGSPCPINYVKAKLALENLNAGDKLEVILDEGEPIANVPKSLGSDGHKILLIEKQGEYYRVVVEKGNL